MCFSTLLRTENEFYTHLLNDTWNVGKDLRFTGDATDEHYSLKVGFMGFYAVNQMLFDLYGHCKTVDEATAIYLARQRQKKIDAVL